MDNSLLLKNIENIENVHKQILDDLYNWFDNNQKDNKICIKGKILTFYYYKKNDMLYQEDNDGWVEEIDLLSINELYGMMKIIVNAQ